VSHPILPRISEREIITELEEIEDDLTDWDPPFKGSNFIKAMLKDPIELEQGEDGVWRPK
jgi:hypothetical protein